MKVLTTPSPCLRKATLAGIGLAVACLSGSAESAPSHLALLPLDPQLRTASDLLTAESSKDDRVALLERAQIDKIIAEQALSRVNAGDYVKVGELLGAQGLLILELGKEDDRELLTSRLVAVGPGVVLGLEQLTPALLQYRPKRGARATAQTQELTRLQLPFAVIRTQRNPRRCRRGERRGERPCLEVEPERDSP